MQHYSTTSAAMVAPGFGDDFLDPTVLGIGFAGDTPQPKPQAPPVAPPSTAIVAVPEHEQALKMAHIAEGLALPVGIGAGIGFLVKRTLLGAALGSGVGVAVAFGLSMMALAGSHRAQAIEKALTWQPWKKGA